MSGVVRMLAFAGVRDLLGASEMNLTVAGASTAAEFLDDIFVRFPVLVPYRRSLRLAVNGVYADATDVVREGDEIALIPPVAGG